MKELKLTIETDNSVGTVAVAQRVLEVLTQDPKWTPEGFGTDEPLRDRFQSDAPHAFTAAWAGAAGKGRLRSFHFQNRRRYRATAMWWTDGGDLSSVHFTFSSDRADEKMAMECLELGRSLFEAVEGQYGHLCLREEYWSKNVTGSWTGKTGQPEGGKAHGTDRTKHLPGIYWANFFGPIYVAFFGEQRLRSAPTSHTRCGEMSCLLLTSASPYSWKDVETVQRERDLREHLGRDAFFLLREPTRPTRAPSFAPPRG